MGNRDDVVIAKSEWKKLAKWMKEVGKDGLVKTKETKGEVIITGLVRTIEHYLFQGADWVGSIPSILQYRITRLT